MVKTINLGEVKKGYFKSGEINTTIEPIKNNSIIILNALLKTADDLVHLMMTINAINQYNVKAIYLYVPYLPYSRQDRVCNNGEAFSLEVIADVFNSLNVEAIYTIDIHNEKSLDLFNNLISIPFNDICEYNITKDDVHVIPDDGAFKKYHNSKFTNRFCVFNKVRNPKTREIVNHTTEYPIANVVNRSCFIMDDICDGGRTFIGMAKKLKDAGAKKVILIIPHGIFSYGVKCILDSGIDKIVCGDHMLYNNDEYYLNEKLTKKLHLINTKKLQIKI